MNLFVSSLFHNGVLCNHRGKIFHLFRVCSTSLQTDFKMTVSFRIGHTSLSQIFIILLTFPQVYSDSLNIQHELTPFGSCSVHIIEAVLEDHHRSGTIGALDFPVARSVNTYRPANVVIMEGFLYCSKETYKLRLDNQTIFKKTKWLSRALTCEVTVYLSPWKWCKIWKTGGSTLLGITLNQIAPQLSHMFEDTSSDVCQGNRYFVLVGTRETATVPFMSNIIYLMDAGESKSVSFRKKLFIEVNPQLGNVAHSLSSLEFSNLEATIGKAEENCGQYSFSTILIETMVNMCFQSALLSESFQIRSMTTSYENTMSTEKIFWTLMCSNCNYELDDNGKKRRQAYHFRTWRGSPHLEYIYFKIIFPNSTVETNLLRYNNRVLRLMRITVEETSESMQFVRLENKGYYFVTCANKLELAGLSLLGLLGLFDSYTWICLCLSSLISSTFMLYILHVNGDSFWWRRRLQLFTFTFNSLLEQGIGIIEKKCQTVTGAWLLISVVLTHFYRGDNITNLTAPLGFKKLEYFDQLLSKNLTFYSSLAFQSEIKENKFDSLDVGNFVFDALGFKESERTQLVAEYLSQYTSNFESAYVKTITSASPRVVEFIYKRSWKITSFDSLKQFHSKKQYFVEQVGDNCGTDVYLDSYGYAYKSFLALKRAFIGKQKDSEIVSISKESLAPIVITWRFYKVPWNPNYVVKRVHSFIQSGLVQVWTEWSLRVQTWQDKVSVARSNYVRVKSLSLKDNIRVIFYLYLCLIFMAVGIFVAAEAKSKVRRGVMRCLSNLCGIFSSFNVRSRGCCGQGKAVKINPVIIQINSGMQCK